MNRLSWSTFLIAMASPVLTTFAWNTTPKDPLPMILADEYDSSIELPFLSIAVTVVTRSGSGAPGPPRTALSTARVSPRFP